MHAPFFLSIAKHQRRCKIFQLTLHFPDDMIKSEKKMQEALPMSVKRFFRVLLGLALLAVFVYCLYCNYQVA